MPSASLRELWASYEKDQDRVGNLRRQQDAPRLNPVIRCFPVSARTGERMDEAHGQIPRRKMLKRIGAGAAVAWTAPLLTSIRTPAFAQASPGCGETCPVFCQNNPICNDPNQCTCQALVGGGCACLCQCGFCFQCASDADCEQFGPGSMCIQFDCPGACPGDPTTACASPCGAAGQRSNNGVRVYSRTTH
jgi:hypothetical protein